MARAYASTIIDAPVETVWSLIRDFNGLPSWVPGITDSRIEDGLDADVVGCVRAFRLPDGTLVRERLLSLDDHRYSFSYNFETPAFPVTDYLARVTLIPVTNGDGTFAEWEATFDERPEDAGTYAAIIADGVFKAGWDALKAKVARERPGAPAGAVRWQGLPPHKVFCSSVIPAPVEAVWATIRDFAGMADWHEGIARMHMLGGVRPDKVSGVRDFLFGEGHLNEELIQLCDRTRSYTYRITRSPMPWLHYVSGPRLRPVTDGDRTFGTWFGDWTAAPADDLVLIPQVHHGVYQKAFDTVAARLARGPAATA
ncbi:hypothetical protein VQ02_11820 [Methylobacterium variabile]|jgi:uncharacterized protein YndB with AHSA1/START domain|uniref:Polyketide cyclase n=1 Tax=Methylobacterium variabile TaxID=298794 RepID=A0A0J6SXT5_9HYPH|nr:SRPBCC family protein [Methylobacterium variabile]KMO38412.1 hypothetical protein VQ02_11820 [Methylobacterium variabile]